MRINGKFKATVRDIDGSVVGVSEGKNLITDDGLDRMVEWLLFDGFNTGSFPAIKEIDTTGMTVTSTGFADAGNAIDTSDSTYSYGTINNSSWDNVWWKIDLGESKSIAAIYVDWSEDDVNYGCDYKFQYSPDNSAWTDFEVRLRPPQEADVRGKVLFFVRTSPPFTLRTGVRYIRLNTKRGSDTDYVSLFRLKFYEQNFVPQPPMVMKIGDGVVTPSGVQTDLQGENQFSKLVSTAVCPSGCIARYVMSLDGDEANDITFGEAGMFFCSENYQTQTTANIDKMFSRGLFDSTWSKSSGQTADVQYEIEVLNP